MDYKKLERIDEMVESISDDVFKKSIAQYEKESNFDKSKIKSDEEFFDYVENKIEAVRAHNERYTVDLVKRLFKLYMKE